MKKPKCADIPEALWPPKGAIEESLEVYRLTRQENVIASTDFLSRYELDKNKGIVQKALLDNDIYYALSVYEDIDDAKGTMRKFPHKFKSICEGRTVAEEGCVRPTPSESCPSHRSWWLYEEADPVKDFKIVEENHE